MNNTHDYSIEELEFCIKLKLDGIYQTNVQATVLYQIDLFDIRQTRLGISSLMRMPYYDETVRIKKLTRLLL